MVITPIIFNNLFHRPDFLLKYIIVFGICVLSKCRLHKTLQNPWLCRFFTEHGYPSVSVLVADITIPLAGCFIAYTSFYLFLYILLYNTTPCQEVFLLFATFFKFTNFQALTPTYRDGSRQTNNTSVRPEPVEGQTNGIWFIRRWFDRPVGISFELRNSTPLDNALTISAHPEPDEGHEFSMTCLNDSALKTEKPSIKEGFYPYTYI